MVGLGILATPTRQYIDLSFHEHLPLAPGTAGREGAPGSTRGRSRGTEQGNVVGQGHWVSIANRLPAQHRPCVSLRLEVHPKMGESLEEDALEA